MVLEELDRQEVLDDAVVIVSGDHGDAFGEHGVYSDHVCADECIHHIPLIIRWPGVTPENESCDSLLYNVDMSATLCDLLGCEIPADWDGTSFAKNVRNGSDEVGHPYLVWDHGLYAVQRAVRTRTHLMVRTYHPFKYDFKPLELYDLSKDPYQTTDISESSVEIVQECDSHMSEWIQVQKSKGNLIRDPLDTILSDTERYPPVKRTD
jgi:arylsulfatase A-like enzyme